MGHVDRLGEAARPTSSIREATGAGSPPVRPVPAAGPALEAAPVAAAAKKPAARTAPALLVRTTSVRKTGGERRRHEDDRRRCPALRASGSTIGTTGRPHHPNPAQNRKSGGCAAPNRTRHTAAGSAGRAPALPPESSIDLIR